MTERVSTRVIQEATRVELPTIDEDEIEKIRMKKYKNTIQRGEVTHYFEDEKLYFVVYESGDNEKISHRLLNQYRCTNINRDRIRRIMKLSTRLQQANKVKEIKTKPSLAGGKLPAHFLTLENDRLQTTHQPL